MNEVVFKKRFNVKKDLFSDNEQGLWLDPSDMTAGKAGWRRNLLTYSEQLDNSVWSKDLSSISANASTSPDGTTTADKLIPDNTSGVHRLRLLVLSTTSFSFTVSFYAKASEISKICFREGNTTGAYAAFDLSNGTIIHQGQGGTGAVISVGSGWYRCSVSFTAGASARIDIIALPNSYTSSNSPIENFTFNGTDGFFLWGIQYEQSSTPTEYQRITDFSTEFKQAFPLHTLYQDSNGVTPCTDSGQPVGLILDQSRGGLGAKTQYNLTNGSFDSGSTGWTASNATVDASVSGQLTVTGASAGSIGIIQQEITGSVAGQWWEIVADVQVTSNSGVLGFWTGAASSTVPITGTHRQTVRMITLAAGTVQARVGTVNVIGASIIVYDVKVYQIPGNHAYQSSSSARPTLARIPSSGRRNLLTRTEEFDNAAWTKNAVTVTANASSAPDGTTTMDTVVNTTATDVHGIYAQLTTTAATAYTLSCYVKKNTVRYVSLGHWGGASLNCGAGFDLDTGTVTGTGAIGTGYSATGASIQNVGGGIYRISVSVTQPTTVMYAALINRSTAYTSGSILESYAGQVTESTHVWGMQLELGSTATNYQKVVATTDVTESGVGDLWHLVFDGSDDSLVTNSVDFNTWTQETRRNLLVDTESFGTASWTKTNATVTENTVANPVNGETTADKLVETAATGFHSVYAAYTYGAGSVVTLSVYAKAAERSWLVIGSDNAAAEQVFFDLVNGTVGNQGTGYVGSIASVGNGWYRCSVVITQATALPPNYVVIGMASANNTSSYAGDGTSGILIWGAQLEIGSTMTTYQRVGTDEMTVIAGVRKLSDAAIGMVAELTASANSNNGSFYLRAPGLNADPAYWFASNGSTIVQFGSTTFASPISNVVSGIADISGDSAGIRVNGISVATSSNDQGAGNYSNAAIYIGRRGGSSLPYNGHIYQLIIRGKTTPTGKLLEAEKFVSKKTGVNL